MHTFLSQNLYIKLIKPASSKCVTFVELDSILLKIWLSLLQMPRIVVVPTIVTVLRGWLCFNQHNLQSIQNTLAPIITNHRKYADVTTTLKRLHSLPVSHHCIFTTATLVYKFLHSGSPTYFGPICPFVSAQLLLQYQA